MASTDRILEARRDARPTADRRHRRASAGSVFMRNAEGR